MKVKKELNARFLYKFLHRNNIFYPFMENTILYNRGSCGNKEYSITKENMLERLEAVANICNAFFWGEAREGACFWSDLSEKFEKALHQYYMVYKDILY